MLDPQSEFVKSKIKGTKLTRKNIIYIENLVSLEEVALGIVPNIRDFDKFYASMYPVEYAEISKELNPSMKSKVRRARKFYRERDKFWIGFWRVWRQRIEEQRRKEQRQLNLQWKQLGGKLR